MARQIQSSPSNKRISELYRRIKEGSLIPQPEFQRKFVWTKEHKESFVETILQGLPFPEIYLAQTGIDMDTIVSTEVVVDGQQRLSTIVQYIDEKAESDEFGKKVPLFGQLDSKDKEDFLNYLIVVRDLGDIPGDTIKEIFQRINRTKFSLEQIEIHNAVYDGAFISTAKEILNEVKREHIPIFSDSELTRMADLHFILLIMCTLESEGYFPFDKEIEKYVQEFNNEYPNSSIIKTQIIQAFEQVKSFEFAPDSLWYRKSNFFTLIVELSRNRFDGNLKYRLLEFEQKVADNKQKPKGENKYSTYYSYMYTGTNSRQARVIRSKILLEEIE